MNTPCITNWFGRLGNNIQQISNAIYFCQKHNINFYLPIHPHINFFKIEFGKDTYLSNRFFFFTGNNPDFNCQEDRLNLARKSICEKYILPNLKLQPNEALDDDTLVIHIRSGDIFNKGGHHNQYVQNPLWYYEELIEKFRNTIIVTDMSNKSLINPVIPYLIQNKKVSILSNTIEQDFATLLAAKNLASSGVGTFCVAAALCSTNLKNFYASTIYRNDHLNPTMLFYDNIHIYLTHIKNYIIPTTWTNSEDQRGMMINHNNYV